MEKYPSIYIYDKNENSREILKLYLLDIRNDLDIKLHNYTESFINALKEDENTSIAIVDISEKNDEVFSFLNKVGKITPKLIVTSTDFSTDTIVKSMRAGAKDILSKPVLKDDLKRIINIMFKPIEPIDESTSKIISVYSNKGGIGKTTIATNLALEIAKTTRDKVALIDLNLQLGDISTFLNLEPSFDVAYVVKNLINKKEDSFMRAFEKYKDSNLYILSDPNYIEQAESITPQEIELLLKNLKNVFPYIIIDMSANIDSNSLKILDKSDLILFTSIVNIPAIRNAQRCINLFKSRNYSKNKVKILINRYMENDDIKISDIEEALNEKIYWKITNNYFSIME